MQEYRRNEIKVGLTVIVGLLVLIIGFSVFKDWSFGHNLHTLQIRFKTSAGLQAGDPVTLNGVKAGRVSSVTIDRNGVLVRAELGEEFIVAADAVASIQMLELMGGKKIEILQGYTSEPFDFSRIMEGRVDPDIAGAFAMVGDLEGNVRALTEKANTLLDNVNALTGDSVIVAAIRETVASLRILTRDMREMVTENKSNVQDISRTLVSLTHRTDTLITELHPLLKADLKKADAMLVNADSLLGDIRAVVSEIKTSKGMIHTLISDTTLNHRFDALLSRVDSVMSIIIDGQMKIKIRL